METNCNIEPPSAWTKGFACFSNRLLISRTTSLSSLLWASSWAASRRASLWRTDSSRVKNPSITATTEPAGGKALQHAVSSREDKTTAVEGGAYLGAHCHPNHRPPRALPPIQAEKEGGWAAQCLASFVRETHRHKVVAQQDPHNPLITLKYPQGQW